MTKLCMVSFILMIIGAINWGLYGLLGMNLVEMLLGGIPILATITYGLIGASGLYAVYGMITKKGKCS